MKLHRRRTLTAIAAVGALIGAALIILPAQATLPSGVTTTMIGVGRFGEIDVTPLHGRDVRIHVLQNAIAPGGSFGWHSHPGPSLVIVKSGTATFYLAKDRSCTPQWSRPGRASWIRAATCTWCATRAASTW